MPLRVGGAQLEVLAEDAVELSHQPLAGDGQKRSGLASIHGAQVGGRLDACGAQLGDRGAADAPDVLNRQQWQQAISLGCV